MNRYKHLHLWMLIPLLIAQVGIFRFYWPNFSHEFWEIHVHYWLVTFWYAFLVWQPYLINQQKIEAHRTWGLFGFLLAGGVFFTAISLLDMPLKYVDKFNPNRPGPPLSFFYATLIAEFVSAMAFAVAVIQGIRHRHHLEDHAWWMMASVFYMIVPALGRGMVTFWQAVLADAFIPIYVFISTEVIYVFIFVVFAKKFGQLKHWATAIGLALVLVRILSRIVGNSEAVQNFLKHVIIY